MDTLTLGPASGTLTLHTGVEGRAARLGHDLTIAVSDWSAQVTFDGDVPAAVRLRAGLASLHVVKAEGGVKPVSEKDRQAIRDNALSALRAATHQEVTFCSTSVRAVPGGFAVDGDLSIAGATRQTSVELSVADDVAHWTVTGGAPVVQSAYGVAPHSAMMGALKVRDRVDVRIEATIEKG